jgi:hypothetical protein
MRSAKHISSLAALFAASAFLVGTLLIVAPQARADCNNGKCNGWTETCGIATVNGHVGCYCYQDGNPGPKCGGISTGPIASNRTG